MKTTIIYFSPTGSTKYVAKIIAKVFGAYEEIDLCNRNDSFDITFHEDDLCVFAIPSYGGRVPEIATKRLKKLKGNHAKAILVAVYGNRAYEDTLIELQDITLERGFRSIAAIAAIAKHSIMNQYATDRPNADDVKQLQSFANAILTKLHTTTSLPISIPGNHPYRNYSIATMLPQTNETCIGCAQCANACPVEAIAMHNPKITDATKCICCMRCVKLCPIHARSVDPLKVEMLSNKLKSVCEIDKENELFL